VTDMGAEIFVQLAEDYGLKKILEQNDIEEWEVLYCLWGHGLLDLDDYIFEELEDLGDDD